MSETQRGQDTPAGARAYPYNLVLIGLPGAGKGTQASQFARRRGIPKISTGDILRDAVARDTPLGRLVDATISSGSLVPDDLIVDVVRERLARPDTSRGFVLDGFPRTVPQAMALDSTLSGRGALIVVHLKIDPAVIIQRVLTRRTCESCGQSDTGAHMSDYCASCGGHFVKRADDHIDIVRQRLMQYVENTQPLVDWYRKGTMFREIDGSQPLADVARGLDAAVSDCMTRLADSRSSHNTAD